MILDPFSGPNGHKTHISPRLLDLVLCGETLGDVELIEDVRINVERHRRRVPSLACIAPWQGPVTLRGDCGCATFSFATDVIDAKSKTLGPPADGAT